MRDIFDKDFLKQVLLIWIGVNLSKQTFKEQKQRCGRVSNMKPQEIVNNGGKYQNLVQSSTERKYQALHPSNPIDVHQN